MRFLAAVLLVTYAQGELINLVPGHVKVAYTSTNGAAHLTDNNTSTCHVYDKSNKWWGSWKGRSKAWVMFAGAAIGVEYNVKRVRVNFQDFDKDLKDAQVYVVSHGVEKLCGRINQNQNANRNEAEKWVEVTCTNEQGQEQARSGGSVMIRGSVGYLRVCEIGVYVKDLPDIPESWAVTKDTATASQNDGKSNETVATKAINGKYGQWDPRYCAEVDVTSSDGNNTWEAKFDEPQYVKGVVIYSLIKFNRPAKHLIHEATVWVEKEDGQLKQCGVSIGEGVGEVSAPVNMVWCDEIATKVVIERNKTIKGVARTLVLCEVEINAVAIPEVPTEEGTEVVDERNYGGPFGQ